MGAKSAAAPSSHTNKSTTDRAVVQIPALPRFGFHVASRMSPSLGARVAAWMFYRPRKLPLRAGQRAMLAQARRVTLSLRGDDFAAYCWGEGPTVLLLHGWSGHAGQMTDFVAPLTRAGYRVVAMDAPGHGASARGRSSVMHFAHALEAAADVFGPVHAVVAHSLGAAATVQAMRRGMAPGRVVFLAPQADVSVYWRHFAAALGMPENVAAVMRTRSERWLKTRYDDLHPAVHAPSMRTPLLVLHGLSDRMTPFSEGETLARLWPGAVLEAIPGGHVSILRDWRALLACLDFLGAARGHAGWSGTGAFAHVREH